MADPKRRYLGCFRRARLLTEMYIALRFVIILLVLVSGVFAQTWQQLYDQALRDLQAARWEDAIARLQEAVKQQPASGQEITGEQGQTLRYFPYYLLGKAHFHLGRYAEAGDFFAREARQTQLPVKLAKDIEGYQQQIQAALAGAKRTEFNRALQKAEAARLKQAYGEAAAELERARELDSAEFKARGLDFLLTSVRKSEKKLAEESRFWLLVRQAEEKEQQGALPAASLLLEEADRLIPGRIDVARIRARIKDREQTYARLKEAAASDEKEGRLAAAADKLRQAAQADPQRSVADGVPAKLAEFTASLSSQAEIQQQLIDGAREFAEGDYPQAIEHYEKVLEKDRFNRVALEQKRRAESLQLIQQAQNFIRNSEFRDALAAFIRSYRLNESNGELIYDRMRPHVQSLGGRQTALRRGWLELMREADPNRFRRENPGASAAAAQRQRQRPKQAPQAPAKPNPDDEREKSQQEAFFAAIQGPPEEAVRLLQRLRTTRGKSDAELESWTGVAYARLSLLTSDPEERKRLHAKASEHFRLALRMDPQHELNPRLVAPHIQRIFREAQQAE